MTPPPRQLQAEIELPTLHAGDECLPLVGIEEKCAALSLLRGANGGHAVSVCDFYAVRERYPNLGRTACLEVGIAEHWLDHECPSF